MRGLPDTIPAEEKRKWEVELRMLWEQMDKNPRDSPQHNEAKGKLLEFSDALISKLRAPERSALFQQQQQIANRSAALTSTIPMSIPHSRDPVPPPLPPPRRLADISEGRSNRPDITYVWESGLSHENDWGSDSPQRDMGGLPADNDDRSILEPIWTLRDNNAAPSQPISKVYPYSALPPPVTPPTQYDTRFRGNSFDAIWTHTPVAQNYVHVPDRLGTPLSTQYAQLPYPGQGEYSPLQDAEGDIGSKGIDTRRLMDDQGHTASLA
jgi:hypothetical protein